MVCLIRHGETAWTLSGQHTGRTDIALTEQGESEALGLSAALLGMSFANVLTVPCGAHDAPPNSRDSPNAPRPIPI